MAELIHGVAQMLALASRHSWNGSETDMSSLRDGELTV